MENSAKRCTGRRNRKVRPMIYGSSEKVMTALEFISSSTVLFYLTGSRFFGTQREDSDYDFFTKANPVTEKLLDENGFHLDSESYECDRVMTKVYKRDNVHVQLVNNVRAKQWVQTKLHPFVWNTKPSKEHLKLLWRLALTIYDGGMDEQKTILRREAYERDLASRHR